MAKSSYKPYTPNPELTALIPDTSGNAVNGLGETTFRLATPVYWRDPDTLAHGEMQKWFYTRDPDNEAVSAARENRAAILEIELPEVAPEAIQQSADDWFTQLSEYAAELDIELFGVAGMNPDWTFEDSSVDYDWVIMVGVAHDYEQIKTAPKDLAGAEVIRQYGRATKAAKDLTSWIRERGWNAEPQAGPMAGPLLLIPPAIECGFGELGKHGSIINKEYGSSFRLASVLTSIPLQATPKQSYDVDDFCSRCQVCANACPPDAIGPEKVPVRGKEKWYVDFDKCIPFFNENYGCGICIAVCPWSIPGRGPRIVEQLLRRKNRHDHVASDADSQA
jgi:epoxyqueuosine reductase